MLATLVLASSLASQAPAPDDTALYDAIAAGRVDAVPPQFRAATAALRAQRCPSPTIVPILGARIVLPTGCSLRPTKVDGGGQAFEVVAGPPPGPSPGPTTDLGDVQEFSAPRRSR